MPETKKPIPDFNPVGTRLAGFILCKCPRCRQSNVFKHSIFHITKFTDTNLECSVCKLDYMPEPGFFFGAMYWSYAMIVGFIITLSIVFYAFNIFDYAIVAIPVGIIVMLPLIFRYSRMLMLYVIYPLMYKQKYAEVK